MTKSVIKRGMAYDHPVLEILNRWPDRQAVFEDVKRDDPEIDMIAVHRWFQRCSVPPSRWRALLHGARRRGIYLIADELIEAHAPQPLRAAS